MRLLSLLLILWSSLAVASSVCESQAKKKSPVAALVSLMAIAENLPGGLTLDELVEFARLREWTNPFRARPRTSENLAFATGFDKVARLVKESQRGRVFAGVEEVIRQRKVENAKVDTARDQTQFVLDPKILRRLHSKYEHARVGWGAIVESTFEGRAIFLAQFASGIGGPEDVYNLLLDPMNPDADKQEVLTREVYNLKDAKPTDTTNVRPVTYTSADGSLRVLFRGGEIFDVTKNRTVEGKFTYGGRNPLHFSRYWIAQTKSGPRLVTIPILQEAEGHVVEFDLENLEGKPHTLLTGRYTNLRVDHVAGEPWAAVTAGETLTVFSLNDTEKVYHVKLKGELETRDRFLIYGHGDQLFALYHLKSAEGEIKKIDRVNLKTGEAKTLAEFTQPSSDLVYFTHQGRPFARMRVEGEIIILDLVAEKVNRPKVVSEFALLSERSFAWEGQTYLTWSDANRESPRMKFLDIDSNRFDFIHKLPMTIGEVFPFRHGENVYALMRTSDSGMPYLVQITASTKEIK